MAQWLRTLAVPSRGLEFSSQHCWEECKLVHSLQKKKKIVAVPQKKIPG